MKKVSLFLVAVTASVALVSGAPHLATPVPVTKSNPKPECYHACVVEYQTCHGTVHECAATYQACITACKSVPVAMPRDCREACHADEYDKVSACGQSGDCVHAVESAIAECDAACSNNPPALAQAPAQVGNQDPKVCADACYATAETCQNACNEDLPCLGQCENEYQFLCAPQCQPTQAQCNAQCTQGYSDCTGDCQAAATYKDSVAAWAAVCPQYCAKGVDACTQACAMKAPVAAVESKAEKPVEGVACVAACKLASKAASAACKFQKPSHRARCKENVAKVETDCEAACVLIPTVKVTETTKPQSHHSTVGAPAFALAESEYQKHFTSFVQKHGKKYTRDEFFPRYSIFKANLNKIHTHNAKGLSYSMAVNEFADMTFTEFHAKMTGYKRLAGVRRSTQGPHTMLGRAQLASSVDWRQKNAVTPVKNQQQCGSCWSFSATGSTEGAHAIKTGNLVSLSEQQLVDCSAAQGNQGCNGGMMDAAFQYIIANGGITTEQAYPYTATQGTCQTNVTVAATLTSFVDVTSGSETALMQAVNIGPVSVAIEADQQCFQFYSGGVLSDPSCGTNLDHGVLVVGYGTDNTVSPPADYWIVKNSWGDSWGEDGYIRLARGSNECGIATEPSYPVV